jgi:3-oxoacyl-[acyl-carrier-protein] synthase-1
MVRRAVVTGLGIVSPLGKNVSDVLHSLQNGISGIDFREDYKTRGLNSQVSGVVKYDADAPIDRKNLRFMSSASKFAYLAMREAIQDAGLDEEEIQNPRFGLVAASGGVSLSAHVEALATLEAKGIRKVSPFYTPKIMSSTVSANLATAYKIKGINYSITSACSTSAHCIGNAVEQIQLGKQDIVFAGGGEEEEWSLVMYFDAMRATTTKFNDTPTKASRPYDVNRDGFVFAGGAGILVVEELEHAKARGAKIYAEVTGYAATSDGMDMVKPSGEGAARCMQLSTETVGGPIDYINTHGTSTPAGDIVELEAIREVFGNDCPKISSTKSLSGHALGAAGSTEAIYSLLMLKHKFIAASTNIENLDPKAEGFPIVRETESAPNLKTVMSNSFGFGGTNACLVFEEIH